MEQQINCGTNLAAWQQAKQPCNKIKKTCRLSFDPRIYYDHGTTTISTWAEQDKLWSHKIPNQTEPTNKKPRRIGINCVWCLETNKKCLILMSSFFIYVLIWWYFRCLSMKLNYGEIENRTAIRIRGVWPGWSVLIRIYICIWVSSP